MYAVRSGLLLLSAMRTAPFGNESCGRLVMVASRKYGVVVRDRISNSYGNGSTSNMPKPERTTRFPLFRGDQATPMRGSKFRAVGLEKYGSPKCRTVS